MWGFMGLGFMVYGYRAQVGLGIKVLRASGLRVRILGFEGSDAIVLICAWGSSFGVPGDVRHDVHGKIVRKRCPA